MATVGVVDVCTSLKAYTIVAGAVKMSGSVEIVNLFFLNTSDSVIIHLAEYVRIRLTASNACRGDKMCVDGESLRKEYLITGAYHSSIVKVDVVDEEPGAYAVCLESTAHFKKLHVVLVEEQTGLIL